MFSKLVIHHWRQFNRVEIDFHRRLTVLTGVNGSGKTTLLHLLNRHWGWDLKYVSSPAANGKELGKQWGGFWGEDDSSTSLANASLHPERQYHLIGELTYSNGNKVNLTVPEEVTEVFEVGIAPRGTVWGVYVPSHRPRYLFRNLSAS